MNFKKIKYTDSQEFYNYCLYVVIFISLLMMLNHHFKGIKVPLFASYIYTTIFYILHKLLTGVPLKVLNLLILVLLIPALLLLFSKFNIII